MKTPFHVIGHRGLPSLYPENTIASFEGAARLAVDAIEFDVHPTRDGQLVITHDDTVDRCSNGHGKVCELTLAELRQLDFGAWKGPAFAGTRIPTLDEALDAIFAVQPGMCLLVELKEADEGCALQVLQTLRRRQILPQVLALSFYDRLMELYRREEPSLLLQGFPHRYVKEPMANSYDIINKTCIWTREISAEEVAFFHGLGIAVDAYAVDNEVALDKVLACGVDSVTTNAADVVLPLVQERGLR